MEHKSSPDMAIEWKAWRSARPVEVLDIQSKKKKVEKASTSLITFLIKLLLWVLIAAQYVSLDKQHFFVSETNFKIEK